MISLWIVVAIFSISFINHSKRKSLVGVWESGPTVKVFLENGQFTDIYFSGAKPIVSHSGIYKVINDSIYIEEVTEQREGQKYALKGHRFENHYLLSKDKERLKLSGTVFTSDRKDSLNWKSVYTKMNVNHFE